MLKVVSPETESSSQCRWKRGKERASNVDEHCNIVLQTEKNTRFGWKKQSLVT